MTVTETTDTPAIDLANHQANPLGPAEVADLLSVKRETVHQWVYRGWTPPPTWRLSGIPVWTVRTILQWANETNRLTGAGGHCSLDGCDGKLRARGLCRRHYGIGFGR